MFQSLIRGIANAIGYCDLLNRHINKEDNAIYNFAKRSLSEDLINKIEKSCSEVEPEAEEKNTQNNYIRVLNELEIKWNK